MPIKYLLIVTVPDGLIVRDIPAPQSMGSRELRRLKRGTHVYAYKILPFRGVPYAWIEPLVPGRVEWVRVAEADGNLEYVEVTDLGGEADSVPAAIVRAAEIIAAAMKG